MTVKKITVEVPDILDKVLTENFPRGAKKMFYNELLSGISKDKSEKEIQNLVKCIMFGEFKIRADTNKNKDESKNEKTEVVSKTQEEKSNNFSSFVEGFEKLKN